MRVAILLFCLSDCCQHESNMHLYYLTASPRAHCLKFDVSLSWNTVYLDSPLHITQRYNNRHRFVPGLNEMSNFIQINQMDFLYGKSTDVMFISMKFDISTTQTKKSDFNFRVYCYLEHTHLNIERKFSKF